MIFNEKVSYNEYVHIINDFGWYIDKNFTVDIKSLKLGKLNRNISEIDHYNHPNIYIYSICNGNYQYCYQEEHIKKNN